MRGTLVPHRGGLREEGQEGSRISAAKWVKWHLAVVSILISQVPVNPGSSHMFPGHSGSFYGDLSLIG